MAGDIAFEVFTPLGLIVRVTRNYWELIAMVKHPVMRDRAADAGGASMGQVKVFYDRAGNTLAVWFGAPQEEYICEETGDEIILMKDRNGQVTGFEKLNFSVPAQEQLRFAFEAVTT